eukprot:GHRR01000793.1.p1 GENE.GHRR01000793.1~~GHRR01000793.1.p1  ORF type:complete len:284 (+),score=70.63 GHRR01000793.1:91-852(+)
MALSMKSSLVATTSKATRSAVRSSVVVRAASRPTWYPGATPPRHLDGSYLGDYGFDPLRLGVTPSNLSWFREAELTNGRWAMAAVAGILFTDLVGLPKFWLAGNESYPIDNRVLLAIGLVVMGVLEAKRYEGWKKTGEAGVLGSFPFDPLNLRSDDTRLKELKNGRLAMLAFVGFCSQAAVQGKGPIDCLKDHIADPWNNNIYTTEVGKETCVTVALLSVWPIIIEATKSLNRGRPEQNPAAFPWAEPWKPQD